MILSLLSLSLGEESGERGERRGEGKSRWLKSDERVRERRGVENGTKSRYIRERRTKSTAPVRLGCRYQMHALTEGIDPV